MGGSHRTLIGLRFPIKHATTDILDFSLDTPLFRSAHSKAYEVAIGKPNFEVVRTHRLADRYERSSTARSIIRFETYHSGTFPVRERERPGHRRTRPWPTALI